MQNYIKLLSLVYIFTFFAVADETIATENNFLIIFSDNVTMTGGSNDLGPTGNLKIIYTDPSDSYKINFDWEIYVNGATEDEVSRRNPDNYRIDALRIFYIQGDHFKYGGGLELLGNLGGKTIQNNIHDIAGDAYIPATYQGGLKITPTINLEYTNNIFNNYIDIYSSLRFPIIIDHGIIDFQASASHTFTNIYQTNIDSSLGLNLDCKKYPDLAAFSGYPLGDFNICTPETILTIRYNNFSFFWEAPLINNNIQNSYLGISYRF